LLLCGEEEENKEAEKRENKERKQRERARRDEAAGWRRRRIEE
jgi:hypothetical protein